MRVSGISFALGTALLLWWGGRMVLAGQLTVGQLLVFLAYLAQFYEPLNQLTHAGATIATATASADRVFEIDPPGSPWRTQQARVRRPARRPMATANSEGDRGSIIDRVDQGAGQALVDREEFGVAPGAGEPGAVNDVRDPLERRGQS